MSASQLTWDGAGNPAHTYFSEPATGDCATCAAPLLVGVPLTEVETPTTANHADYFRSGAKHICNACAWLYGAGKGRPGNYLATAKGTELLVISLDSIVADKRPWLHALRDLAQMPPGTRVAGVMTTDVKPRLWPRVRLATVQRMGLYVHAPDYDVSEWRQFDLTACLGLIEIMVPMLRAGFAKASLHHGLLRDRVRCGADIQRAFEWDASLRQHRGDPHFLPSLIAAGTTKEGKQDVKPVARPITDTKPSAAGCDSSDKAQFGLFQ